MKSIRIQKQASISLTADQWQLYASMAQVEHVADSLNTAIERAFNRGDSRAEVERQAREVMRINAEYGATDTEPRWVLADLLDELYGKAN